jgi:glycosyltransferase involved in cell wall biosynthesis
MHTPATLAEPNPSPGSLGRTTAIIPVFNGAAFIETAIRSVQSQLVSPQAILVIDDCSTDGTRAIVSKLAMDDRRITLLTNDENCGPSFSRNRALELANTEFVAFLDADDQWLPDHLEKMEAAFNEYPYAALAYSLLTPARLSQSGIGRSPLGALQVKEVADPLIELLFQNPIMQSATAAKTADVIGVGGYSAAARYAEDFDLWMRLALAGSHFLEIQYTTAVRVLHSEQVSAKFAHRMYAAAWLVRKRAAEARFGGVESASDDAVDSLQRARAFDLASALNSRSRQLVELVVDITSWIPVKSRSLHPAERLLGWRWPLWRAAAFAYDSLPNRLQNWFRARRVSAPI